MFSGCYFNTKTPPKAIEATFKNRHTAVAAKEFEALSPNFCSGAPHSMACFVKKIGEGHIADTFGTVIEDLKNFANRAPHSLASSGRLGAVGGTPPMLHLIDKSTKETRGAQHY